MSKSYPTAHKGFVLFWKAAGRGVFGESDSLRVMHFDSVYAVFLKWACAEGEPADLVG